jgi:hypothetical protein
MEVQLTVIQWLALLPVLLAAFRVITIGDRLFTSTVTGRHGGETSAQTSLLMAGLSVLAIIVTAGGLGSPENDSIGLALVVLAFGGFMVSHYMLQGFRSRQWQSFTAAAIQEASLYWLMLGVIRSLFSGVQDTGQEFEFLAAGWIVIVTLSVGLILGTFSRMSSR